MTLLCRRCAGLFVLGSVLAVVAGLLPCPRAAAQGVTAGALKPVAQADRVGVVNTAARVTVAGHVPVWADHASLSAVPVNATEPVELTLVLRRSDAAEAAFQKLLADQQTPGSPMYHHAVSPDQQGTLYGPTAHDLAALTGWAASQGLTVAEVSPSRTAVRLTGTVTAVEAALAVHFSMYSVGTGDASTVRRAPDSEPQVPAALAGIIQAIGGLTVEDPHPDFVAHVRAPQPQFYAASNGKYYITPADFAKIYDINPVYAANNTGATTGSAAQHVAVIANSDANPADIQAFFAGIGRTNVTYNVVYANGTAPGYTAGQGEAELDVERVLGTAPGVTVDLVEGLNSASSSAIYNAAYYAVNTLRDPVVTMSFGECETFLGAANAAKWQNLWATAAANMTSVFVSGGDSGAASCDAHAMPAPANPTAQAISGYCSTVSNTCVGGTEFNDSANPSQYWSMTNDPTTKASALGYIPEGAWNDPTRTDANGNLIYYISAGGGGVSQFVARPTWQANTGVTGTQRTTPDISLAASFYHDVYYYCGPNECNPATQATHFVAYGNGGTSASTPSMAAIAALLNTAAGAPQGNLNPIIYRLAGSPVAGQVFHDVTVASSGAASCDVTIPSLCNNTVPGASSPTGGTVGFAVGTGYDLATGWGSLDVANFIRAAVPVNTSLSLVLSGTAVGAAQTVTATATLTAASSSLAAPTGTVQFLVNGVASGAPVALSGTTATSAAISFPAAGTYAVTAVYSGDVLYVGSAATAVNAAVSAQPPALALALATPALSFSSGATSGNSTTVTLTGSNNFAGAVALSCTVSAGPAGAVQPTCAVSPGSVTLSANGAATATVTVSSAASQALLAPQATGRGTMLACAACLGLAGVAFRRRRRLPRLAAWLLFLGGLAWVTGCGGGSGSKPGPSAGGYSVVVNATGTGVGALMPSTATTTLSVTIQ